MRRLLLSTVVLLCACPDKATPVVDAGSARERMTKVLTGQAKLPDGGREAPAGQFQPAVGDGPRIFSGSTDALLAVALSDDGTLVAAGGLDQTVRVWDLTTNTARGIYTSPTSAISALAFSPDGSVLVAADRQFMLHMLETKTLTETRSVVHSEFVQTLQFSRDGSLLAVGGLTGNAAVITVADGKSKCSLRGRTLSFVDGDSAVVAAIPAGSLELTRLADCKDQKNVSTLPQLPFAVSAGSLEQVFTWNGGEGPVQLWNLKTGKKLGAFDGHQKGVTSVALSADGKRAVSGGADQTVRLWDVDGRKEAAQWPAQRLPFVAISGDGKRVAAADGTQIKVWEVKP